MPVPGEWLQPENTLEIRAAESASTARIDTASLLISNLKKTLLTNQKR